MGLPWLENMRIDKPLRLLRGDPPGKLRLERWYYFWVNRYYTDPMTLIRNGENWWTVHPGMNRWIAASLRPPQDYDVILVSNKPLRSMPQDIHSVKLHGLSKLKPYVSPQPKSEDWLGGRAKTTWDQWYQDWNDLAAKIRQGQQGSLSIHDGNRSYVMGQGRILGCWQIKDGENGLHEIASMFAFADSLGWNRL